MLTETKEGLQEDVELGEAEALAEVAEVAAAGAVCSVSAALAMRRTWKRFQDIKAR